MSIRSESGTDSDVTVRLDDRIRLISALLAASDYPEQAQKRRPHGTHAHVRATRKAMAEFRRQPIVALTQTMLDKGAPLEALFTASQMLDPDTFEAVHPLPNWLPGDWDARLRSFAEVTGLREWWTQEQAAWDKSFAEVRRVFQSVEFGPTLAPYFGDTGDRFVFVPNIVYPSDRELALKVGEEMITIVPPPLAWGDSPPWPFDEDTMLMHTIRASLGAYARLHVTGVLRAHPERVAEAAQSPLPVNDQFRAQHATWEEQFTELFVTAIVAMYLETYVSQAEYKSYVLMEKKIRGMNILPGTVSVMRRFLQERGSKYNTLIEFLPLFPKQLRVAKRMVNL
jgi:hypothetical protein